LAGVEGYVICNREGQVLRRFPSMSQEVAELYAKSMLQLATQARGVVRDLNPKNELKYLRIRGRKSDKTAQSEVLVAYDTQFIVIVIQKWNHATEKT